MKTQCFCALGQAKKNAGPWKSYGLQKTLKTLGKTNNFHQASMGFHTGHRGGALLAGARSRWEPLKTIGKTNNSGGLGVAVHNGASAGLGTA